MASEGIQNGAKNAAGSEKLDTTERLEFKGSATQDNLEVGNTPTTVRDEDGEVHYNAPPRSATELVTEVIHAEDDSTLNPWTFRTWFLGEA
jgi:hypothetical protein